MSTGLHNLQPKKGSVKRKKRIGRGNASGHGTYSTRGMKGQKSRTGGSKGLKRKAFKKQLLQIPKLRGFNSPYKKAKVLKLEVLQKSFQENGEINPITLSEKKFISSPKEKFKILSNGEINKKLIIKGCLISKQAVFKVEKAGGKVIAQEKTSKTKEKQVK